MIFIDIDELERQLPEGWTGRAEAALQAVSDAAPGKDRSKALGDHQQVWKELKGPLQALSHNKCWYCESKNLRSDNAVDHFRPKGNVRNVVPPHDGYWWLAFDWKNCA